MSSEPTMAWRCSSDTALESPAPRWCSPDRMQSDGESRTSIVLCARLAAAPGSIRRRAFANLCYAPAASRGTVAGDCSEPRSLRNPNDRATLCPSRGHSVGCYLNNATAERTEKVAGHAATRVWPRLRGRRLSAVAAARCPPPLPHSTIIGWRGWLPRGWLSTEERRPLPESREEIRSHLEITGQIDHNTIPINRLETQAGMRAAGSRGMLLREAAGRNSAGISHPSVMASRL